MSIDQARLRELFEYDPSNRTLPFVRKCSKKGKAQKGARAGTVQKETGRAKLKVDGKRCYMHHAVWIYHHGHKPNMLDHIDRDVANNTIENLRQATVSGNNRNTSSRIGSSSKYLGVSAAYGGKWTAGITVDGKTQHLGTFKEECIAALEYDRKAIDLYGEFASLNFPEFWGK